MMAPKNRVEAIAEMLETNTTLAALGVAGEQQEKNNRAKNSVDKHSIKTENMIGEGTDHNFQRALQVLTNFTEDDIGISLHNNSQRQVQHNTDGTGSEL